MSSTDNILLNPVPELIAALKSNAWGIKPESEVLITDCFPVTAEDIDSVRSEVRSTGASKRVVGKAKIVTLEGDDMVVQLDQRGFTVEPTGMNPPTSSMNTYETLESLLIALSPLYVEAMTREISQRFVGFSGSRDQPATAEEELAAEGGEGWS